ncbi:MAG: hypothetical protein J0I69_03260 [Altererythrobacter sp.]|nr:hypothetical protein [Altererythrobacter sp.]OJU61016.1 MAG: hypothetical protein BGO08_12975 [Altererythrobacter sp. 66-12]
MFKEYTLNPGEVVLEVTELSDRFAFGTVHRPDGTLLMAPDGVCVALAAIYRDNWGGNAGHMRVGCRFAAYLSPTREGSTFQYFANRIRLLAEGDGPVAVALEEEAM